MTLGIYWVKRARAPESHPPWHWPVQMGVWFGVGLSLVWLIFYLVTGMSVWAIWRKATQAHLALDRPYWPWLVRHLNDFFMFTGWPLTFLAATGVWVVLRKVFRKEAPGEGDVMILAAALTVIILDLSGTLRGESGRILLFLSPWILLTAAATLNAGQRLGWVLTVTQGIIAIVMIVCLSLTGIYFTRHGETA
ncbi:MAG: hypothetical protein EXR62_17095 [Chloroflexi bacterium]|nr:hypothetical protein [Chloroflexota bacterium]